MHPSALTLSTVRRQARQLLWRLVSGFGVLAMAGLSGCGGGGGGGGDGPEPLLPTLSQNVDPTGSRVSLGERNFFPLNAGDQWRYDRVQGQLVTGAVTRTAAALAGADGSLAVTEVDSTPDGSTGSEVTRTTVEGVWIDDPFEVRQQLPAVYQALPTLLMYPTPFHAVDGVRSVVRQGSLGTDLDGDGRADYYRAEFTQVFRGFETLTVMGASANVARFLNTLTLTLRTTSDNGSRVVHGTEEAWFADGIGLVRSDRSVTDGQGAALQAAYRMELVSAVVGGRSQPASLLWRQRQSGTSSDLFAVAANATRAVAVGLWGTVLTSDDGITWTPRSVATAARLTGVAAGSGGFVAVGDGGTVVSSADGLTWTTRTEGNGVRLAAVTWTGSQYVVVGEAGTVLTSPDGSAWTVRSSGTSLDLTSVAGYATQIVAGTGANTVLVSADGRSWSTQALPSASVKGLLWSGRQFVGVGDFNNGHGQTRITSFDGVHWTGREGGRANEMRAVAWSGSDFVAVGTVGTSVTSSDGVAWKAGVSTSMNGAFSGVAWFKGEFVAVGEGGALYVAAAPATAQTTLFGIDSNGSQAVAVGALGTIRSTSDGSTWTTRSSGVTVHLNAVSLRGPRAVAVGDLGTLLTSDDGVAWQVRPSGTTQRLRQVGWTGSRYLVVGDGGTVLTSTDGLGWSSIDSGVSSDLYGVAGTAGLMLVTGADGSLLRSTDGLTWTPQAGVGGTLLQGAVWSGTQFLVVGNNPNGLTPTLQTSPDGTTWTARSGVVGNGMVAATWSGSRYAVVGSNIIQTSLDGIVWAWGSELAMTTSGNFHGVAWHVDRFLAVGEFGRVVTVR